MSSEIERLQEAMEASPADWKTRRALAEAQLDAGRPEDAARTIAAAPALPPVEAEQIFAASILGGVDPEQALHVLDGVLHANPKSAEALRAKAALLDADGEEAIPEATLITDEDLDEVEKEEAEEPGVAVPKPLTPPQRIAGPPPPDVSKPAPAAAPLKAESAASSGDSAAVVLAPDAANYHPEQIDETAGHILHASDILAMEAEEKEIMRRAELKNKLSSLMISLLVHVLVFFILGLVIIAVPRSNPPQIVAMVQGPAPPTDLPKPEIRPTPTVKQPQPSAKVVKLLTSTNFSSMAVPAVDEPPPELLIPGLSMDEGLSFAISFPTGADGWIGSLPVDMQSRCSLVDRMSRLKVAGGSKKCEDAVNRSLVWLGEQQNPDGSWGKGYPVAMTGLALLAYLGHCETPDSATFAETVVNAATYLMDNAMKNEGKMASDVRANQFAYEHAIGTYALCELFTLSRRGKRRIPGLGDLIKQSVGVLIKGQHPRGSWNYGYKGDRSDVSVCGWQIQALSAAKHTGIEIAGLDACFDKGVNFIRTQQGPKGGFGYDAPGDKISLAGVGVLALQFAGKGEEPEARKGLQYILDTRKSLSYGSINVYEWYYTTQACFQAGGRTWDKWNEMFLEPLLDAQDRTGFWPPRKNDPAERQTKGDGNIYRTCLSTLMLEVYYRYLPTTEKIKK